MPRLTDAERLERAKSIKAKAEADMRALTARLQLKDRKADTRRKIILGAMLIEDAKKNPGTSNWVRARVGKLSGRDKTPFDGWTIPCPPSPAKDAGD